jgi:hypothetical protein
MDAIPENLKAIQSLIGQEQGKMTREYGRSRAYHMACDKMALTLNPKMTGVELERWIGTQIGAMHGAAAESAKLTGPLDKLFAGNGNGGIVISSEIVDNDPDFNPRQHDSMTQVLIDELRPLAAGQSRNIQVKDIETARRLQQNVCHAIKALNWQYLPNGKRGYATKIVGTTLKVKRIA